MCTRVRASGDAGADGGVARLVALGAGAAEASALAPFLASLASSGSHYDAVAARMLRFCRVLRVSASNASRLAVTQPALYALGEADLAARRDALRAALPAGTDTAEVVGKAPTLLLAEGGAIAAAMADLSFLPAALLAPLLEAEPTLLQPTRGPRLAEMRAAWQAGPHAGLAADHVPTDDGERQRLRRYAQDVLSSPYV